MHPSHSLASGSREQSTEYRAGSDGAMHRRGYHTGTDGPESPEGEEEQAACRQSDGAPSGQRQKHTADGQSHTPAATGVSLAPITAGALVDVCASLGGPGRRWHVSECILTRVGGNHVVAARDKHRLQQSDVLGRIVDQ